MRKGRFAVVLEAAQKEAWNESIVKGAFRRTGLVPINPDRIDRKWIVKKKPCE